MFDDILFVLVTCTQDLSRRRGLQACIKSINAEDKKMPIKKNLIVFDNASSYKEDLLLLGSASLFAMSSENIGYWGALNWVNNNYERLLGKKYKYIHPIESDFVLYDIENLENARQALSSLDFLDTIRTQEFSVFWRMNYFKESWSPFRVKRSHVSKYNAVTKQSVSFSRIPGHNKIYLSNWHAKVPALHRIPAFKAAIDSLAVMDLLTETDFMMAMHKSNPKIGILDGGIWWMHLAERKNRDFELSGSFSSEKDLQTFGYRKTRVDFIPKTTPYIRVSKEIKI
jgi:hypothetical protein